MIPLLTGILLGAAVFGTGCRAYFYQREKRLLSRLQEMVDRAADGQCRVTEYSEESLSRLENSFRRYLENSLLSGQEQKGQKERIQTLISDLAHQTLTPISNLKLYTELLQEEENGQLVQTISEETEKLDFLIQSLVKLSRMENGIISVHPGETPVGDLLAAVQSRYQSVAGQKGLAFRIEDTKALAVFDLKWTAEAVGNIVDNAIKYTASGGSIRIGVQSYSFFVRIDIADTGMGIAKEDLPNIFSRFYRSFAVSDLPGVGIGLYLAKYIIQEQKGYLTVSSEKGKGSVFSVFLPCPGGSAAAEQNVSVL